MKPDLKAVHVALVLFAAAMIFIPILISFSKRDGSCGKPTAPPDHSK